MKDIVNTAIELLNAGESFVQATILVSSGSTPRGAGSCMIIRSDGSICGTVGGGALEAGIMKTAPGVMSSKLARVIDIVLDGNDEIAVDMICGGNASVLVDYIDPKHPGHLEYFTALLATLRSGIQARIVTVPPKEGSSAERCQCLLLPSGPPLGSDGIDPAVISAIERRSGGYDAFTKLDNLGIYLHSVGNDGVAYIFGAGHCGEKLAPVLASVGFSVVVIDDREEFANDARFPNADEIIVPESMDLPFAQREFDGESYIVIVTRGHAHDELVLRGALRTGAGYVGMIGSRRKREAIYVHLLADGFLQSDIERVFSPIGISIDAETPEEIAISIAAEMIKVRAARRGGDS
ncbi:MAG: XdhC family protein [Oscillospiraceae bacterium]|nr:XdhC family protein [Oscillospiraceae bacterium]